MIEEAISAVTEAELRYVVARKPRATRLELAVQEFLVRVETLAWDSPAARHYALLRSAMEDSGTPMGQP